MNDKYKQPELSLLGRKPDGLHEYLAADGNKPFVLIVYMKKSMKRRQNNIWITVGVIVICVLLLYWLFARTLLVEDEELGAVPATIEQAPIE